MKNIYFTLAALQAVLLGHWITVGGHWWWVVLDPLYIMFFGYLALKPPHRN